MRLTIACIISVITLIPTIIIGLIYMTFNLIFMELIFDVAKIWDWAKHPEVALEYLKLLEKRRK